MSSSTPPEKQVTIYYETLDGKQHEMQVAESAVEGQLARLRSLPDVKVSSVRQGM